MNNFCNAVLCRYSEIAIKGQNRSMFEKKLAANLKYLLAELGKLKVSRIRGRMWFNKPDQQVFAKSELELIRRQLPKAFGLQSFSPGVICDPDLDMVKKIVGESCNDYFKAERAKHDGNGYKFRVRVNRSFKKYPLNHSEIEIALADTIEKNVPELDDITVDLINADLTIGCDFREEFAFVFYENYPAPGGLPVGSNAAVLTLLSGGIDSPVASILLMKRGCPVDFITFDSSPYTPPESVEKVERLVNILNTFQAPRKLFVCNLVELQKQIRDHCTERFRTVLYRRMMFRIAEAIARRNKNLALITGESVGQVASQTVVNLNTINAATDLVVLRPLTGMNKEEVIKLARSIGTYDISAEQVPDSCTVFAPEFPRRHHKH